MKFTPCSLPGAFIVEPEPHLDERGFFARTLCVREFQQHGLVANFVQCSISSNSKRGTLRGLHYQQTPACETKLVRCTSGAILDVIIDLRQESPSYLQHVALELSAKNRWALYVPPMFAHGFQTLRDDTEVFYQISEYYTPNKASGLRFDDPCLGIEWPLPVTVISEKDRRWPLLGTTQP